MTAVPEVLRLIADHAERHNLAGTIQGVRFLPDEPPGIQVPGEQLEEAISAWSRTLDNPVLTLVTNTAVYLCATGFIGGVEVEVTGVAFDARAEVLRRQFGVAPARQVRTIEPAQLVAASRKVA